MNFSDVSKRRRAIALFTASQWHSSEDPGGRLMLSLSSTYTIHSEEHREGLLREIRSDIDCLFGPNFRDLSSEARREDIRRLVDLWELVRDAPVGFKWLSYEENCRLNDRLYEAGVL